MSARGSAFLAPAWRRLLPALGVGLAWLACELAIAGATRGRSSPIAAPPADEVAITIEATAPIAAWSVAADGAALTATASDAHRWSGRGHAHRLSVRAEPADPLADGPAALRVHVSRGGVGRERLMWGSGGVSGSIGLDAP